MSLTGKGTRACDAAVSLGLSVPAFTLSEALLLHRNSLLIQNPASPATE